LKDSKFNENDSPYPVTTETSSNYSDIDGVRRYIIDTQGLKDGETINETQVQKMGEFLNNWDKGIDVIAVVLNGQDLKFSQETKDIIRFACKIFGTSQSLSNICIIFTKCFAEVPNDPDREIVQTEYRRAITIFLSEVSENQSIPEIPIFFVDTKDNTGDETKNNLNSFHEWALSKNTINAIEFKAVQVTESQEQEYQKGVFVEYEYSDNSRFAVYEDRTRTKNIPTNGDQRSFGDWRVVRKYQEDAGTKSQTTEQRQLRYQKKLLNINLVIQCLALIIILTLIFKFIMTQLQKKEMSLLIMMETNHMEIGAILRQVPLTAGVVKKVDIHLHITFQLNN
jgi:hypothetical protein